MESVVCDECETIGKENKVGGAGIVAGASLRWLFRSGVFGNAGSYGFFGACGDDGANRFTRADGFTRVHGFAGAHGNAGSYAE